MSSQTDSFGFVSVCLHSDYTSIFLQIQGHLAKIYDFTFSIWGNIKEIGGNAFRSDFPGTSPQYGLCVEHPTYTVGIPEAGYKVFMFILCKELSHVFKLSNMCI